MGPTRQNEIGAGEVLAAEDAPFAGRVPPVSRPSGVFFSSDHHFGNKGVIRNCGRPYADVDEMDADLEARWNAIVGPRDTIYYLGDLTFEKRHDWLRRLHGRKIFVRGNHDRIREDHLPHLTRAGREPRYVNDILEIKIDGIFVVLCHYPMLSWNKSFHGSFHFHGHSHGGVKDNGLTRRVDVGVDVWDYRPVRWETLKAMLSSRPKPSDLRQAMDAPQMGDHI